MKVFISILLGMLSGILLAFLISLLVGGGKEGGTIATWTIPVGWVISTIIFVKAKTMRKVLGRVCLTLGLESFALPVFGFIFSIIVGAKHYPTTGSEAEQTGAAIGAMLGGGFITVTLGIVGFFLGLFFVVSAYFLLKETQVVKRYSS